MPIARFECRSTGLTFSLLPVQLIPYYQYTVAAIIIMVVLATDLQNQDQSCCEAAAEQAHPDSNITPFLVWCWLKAVVLGLRRAHAFLNGSCDLRQVQSGQGRKGLAAEVAGYLAAIAAGGSGDRADSLIVLVMAYSKTTGQFFLGQSSQQRKIAGV